MENSFRDEKNIFGLQIDEVAKSNMLETARWTKFLGIVYINVVHGSSLLIIRRKFRSGCTRHSRYGALYADNDCAGDIPYLCADEIF